MPNARLFKSNCTIGSLYLATVASSVEFILKLPSPATFITLFPGLPTDAPMEAPSPKPIVPSPPEDTKVLGFKNLKYCAVQI